MVGERVPIDYKLSMPENQIEKNKGTAAEDQKERGYYYDDAHGYKEYDPEEEEEADNSELNVNRNPEEDSPSDPANVADLD